MADTIVGTALLIFFFSCLEKPALDRQAFGQNSHLNEQFSLEGRFLIQVPSSYSISSYLRQLLLRQDRGHPLRENRSCLKPYFYVLYAFR